MAITGANDYTSYTNYCTETKQKDGCENTKNTTSKETTGKTCSNTREYKKYLTEKYNCLKNSGYSVAINSSLLSKALGDETISGWLEYNLSLIPKVVDHLKSSAAACGSKIISCNINFNGYDDITTDLVGQFEADLGTEKAREELKEKMKKISEEKKAEEKRTQEKKAEEKRIIQQSYSGKSMSDIAVKANKELTYRDSVDISEEALRQQDNGLSLDKVFEYFREQYSNLESADQFKIENPFKMELRASSIFGGDNLFQDYSECQYEVFHNWLEKNAGNLSGENRFRLFDEVKNATKAMDRMNSMEGYRGTSFESVMLLESSRVALEKIKNTSVPEGLRSDFEQLIQEYVHFNEESREQIMEKMTPSYMVEPIGESGQSYKYKDELLSSQRSFYSRAKEDVRDLLREYYSDKSNKDRVKTKLQQYIERYQKKNLSMYSDSGLFDKGLVYLMVE